MGARAKEDRWQRARQVFSNLNQRCNNPNNPDYRLYGLKGVQNRFRSVKDIVDHIGLPPPGMQIDRIDPDGHYERGNVRWTDHSTNLSNRGKYTFRLGRFLTMHEFKRIHQLRDMGATQQRIAELIGISRQRVSQILRGVAVKSFVVD